MGKGRHKKKRNREKADKIRKLNKDNREGKSVPVNDLRKSKKF